MYNHVQSMLTFLAILAFSRIKSWCENVILLRLWLLLYLFEYFYLEEVHWLPVLYSQHSWIIPKLLDPQILRF